MKKLVKKCMCILLALSLFCLPNIKGYAAEPTEKIISISEYDAYISIKNNDNARSQVLVEINLEQELLDRKNLSDEELKTNYGYNNEQITILRNYSGEPLENAPEVRSLLATLSLAVRNLGATSERANFSVYWVWSNVPVGLFTDMIGIYADTTNLESRPITVDYTSTSCSIDYYTRAGQYKTTTYPTVNRNEGPSTRSLKFPMLYSTTTDYAKSGLIYCTVEPAVSGVSMGSVDIYAAYGHNSLANTPTFSLVDLNFQFSNGVYIEASVSNSLL